MSIIDSLTSVLAPHSCLACNAEKYILCPKCANQLPPLPARCYRCQTASPGFLTCPACRADSRLRSVRVTAAYKSTAKALIWKLKLNGTQAAAKVMAQRLAPLIETNGPIAMLVPVPTATNRQRQRGYDQAKLLVHELARQTRLPYRDCLARHGQTHQHGLPRRDRLRQLAAAFRVTRPSAVKGAHIILVDDVVTTGATLEAAAQVLKNAGAADIDAVVFAQPL